MVSLRQCVQSVSPASSPESHTAPAELQNATGPPREAAVARAEYNRCARREILQLIAEGNTKKDIAGRLNLSVLTVETHRKNTLSKLNLRGIADLILYAMRRGIVG
jgi:DNA-binding NarL/FixJ family response regulator